MIFNCRINQLVYKTTQHYIYISHISMFDKILIIKIFITRSIILTIPLKILAKTLIFLTHHYHNICNLSIVFKISIDQNYH